ncbi:MAG: hypothetical protein PHY92_01735 [Alphaproteobacteria bacterium]|nr:hypothetical protein [Alphaproteobacteria bacterium]
MSSSQKKHPLEVSASFHFERFVIKAEVPVLAVFRTKGRDLPQEMREALEDMQTKFAGGAMIYILDTDKFPEAQKIVDASDSTVYAIFCSGKPVVTKEGDIGPDKVRYMLKKAVDFFSRDGAKKPKQKGYSPEQTSGSSGPCRRVIGHTKEPGKPITLVYE